MLLLALGFPSALLGQPASAEPAPEPSGNDERPADETRQPDVHAAFGSGVTVVSGDDSFSFNVRARFQIRATQTHEEGDDGLGSTGFMIRRARLLFQGHFFDRAFEYYFQLGFSNLDMEPDLRSPLRDAHLTWRAARDFNLRTGQMKVPFDRQRVVSSSALMFADRALAVSELNLDRDVGVQAFSEDLLGLGGRLAYQVGLFGGDGRNRIASEAGVLVVGRLQVSMMGRFDDYTESVSKPEPSPKLALAAGAAHNSNTNRARSTLGDTLVLGRVDYRHFEADAMFKWWGWSLQAQWLYRKASPRSLSAVVDGEAEIELARSGWGWFVQSGYVFLPVPLEIAARYGELHPIAPTAISRRSEIGPALGYYFSQHNFKLQADYLYQFGGGGADQHEGRLQMQIFL
jgi:phosphate-selective porin OprO and OprP